MDPGADPPLPDVHLCGYLRKPKSQHRRYFVLRRASEGGPARLEYYESEKKFRAGGPGARPKRSFPLASALSISKRADGRHRHLVVLYGRDGTFGVAAEDGDQQQAWYAALVELHGKAFKEVWQVSLRPRGLGHSRNLVGAYLLCLADRTIDFVKLHSDAAAVVLQLLSVRRCGHSENYFFMEVGRSAATGPGELWMQVDDLLVAQNMHETILEAMKALSEDVRLRGKGQALASAPISGQDAAGTQKPPGSLSDHSALSSDEGGLSPGDSRPPGTPDPLCCLGVDGELDYISMGKLASPDEHCLATWGWGPEPNKRASLPPLALERDAPGLPPGGVAPRPLAVSASYPEGLNLRSTDPSYMAMLPRGGPSPADQDYVPMTPGSASHPRERGGYMLMSPSGSCSPEGPSLWGPGRGEGSSYVNMSPASRSASSTPPESCPLLAAPSSTSFSSLPRPDRHAPRLPPCSCGRTGRLSCSSSTSSESLGELVGTPERHPPGLFIDLPRGALEVPAAAPRSPGEYVSIEYCSGVADYVAMGSCHGPEAFPDTGLNYVDLDLGREAAAAPPSLAGPGQGRALHLYASIDFHRSGGLQGGRPDLEGTAACGAWAGLSAPGGTTGSWSPPLERHGSPPHLRMDLALTAQTLLHCGYWVIVGTLAAMTLSSVALFLRQLHHTRKATPRRAGLGAGLWGWGGKLWPSLALKHAHVEPAPPAEEDPEELALAEALHLLDAVMEKTWHHLQQLERRRGGRRRGRARGPRE
ncbi:hypothetical protein lerEdw1_006352 [Lerista edwardsae]|nr:hypothetical protein lerEdw1_006352 [Lerista edwardsae]